jgi:thioredoxin 1
MGDLMTQAALQSTSDMTFAADVLASDKPVLVDFGADWCGPCKMLAPVLQQIAFDESDRMRVLTLDVDANPDTARTYQVMGMPTLILFKGGRVVAKVVGAQPRTAILKQLEPHLTDH